MSHTLTQVEYKRLKTRLTYRKNRLTKVASPVKDVPSLTKVAKDKVIFEAQQLLSEVSYAQAIFDVRGSPDQWMDWERAKEDAEMLIRRVQPSW